MASKLISKSTTSALPADLTSVTSAEKSTKARVVNVSSGAYLLSQLQLDNINHDGIFNTRTTYGHSKLAQILFTREMARRLGKDSNVKVYALHPGVVETDLGRNSPSKPSRLR